MIRTLSLCEHPIGVDIYKDKKCSCGQPATTQMRLYIKPGVNEVGALAFNRYYCDACLHDFKFLMQVPLTDWHVKIDLNEYTIENDVELNKYSGKP